MKYAWQWQLKKQGGNWQITKVKSLDTSKNIIALDQSASKTNLFKGVAQPKPD